MAMRVVDRLEEIDIHDQQRHRLAPISCPLDQRRQVALHVTAIVEPGQRISDRHLEAQLQVLPQQILVAFPLKLRPHTRGELVSVHRPHQIVIHAHIERPNQSRGVAILDDRKDRGIARPLFGAQMRAKPQAV